MNLPGFFAIVELFLGVGVGLLLVILIVGLIWPSLCANLVLLYAVRSGKYVVQIREENGDICIRAAHEEELKRSKKLQQEFYHKTQES